jgi:hypothetical protein
MLMPKRASAPVSMATTGLRLNDTFVIAHPFVADCINRSSASRSIDNSLGGILLHRCFAPSRRTVKSRLPRCKTNDRKTFANAR